MNSLKIVPFGIAGGVVWGSFLASIAITSMFGWGQGLVPPFSTLYIGYNASVIGAAIGFMWAFVDGFVAGIMFAWLYNYFVREKGQSVT